MRATWSDDSTLTTRINPAVAHYTGQAELADAIQEGLAAKAAGDDATATLKLGRAAKLAAETGNEEATNKLKRVVDIDDADTGTVRLKRDVSKLDEMALDTSSTKTTRVKLMTSRCPQGHTSSTDDFCDVCGEPISAAPSPASTPGRAASPSSPSSSLEPRPARGRAAAGAAAQCPSCGDENLPDALFCEECGYDFTTGQLPPPARRPRRRAPAAPGAEWVAELWIDPDWFAAQEAAGDVRDERRTDGDPVARNDRARSGAARRAAASRRRSTAPATARSRTSTRELTLDHDRWYVEDLGSTNGTFVGTPGDALPTTPLPPHERHELADGERIYLGAWCRIMIRKATDTERA